MRHIWESDIPDDDHARLPDLHQENCQIRQQPPGELDQSSDPVCENYRMVCLAIDDNKFGFTL